MKVLPGDIGTYNGIPVDADNRVLDQQKKPIRGLFAIGNDATSIMGGNYPGAGITLGPALTFGYAVGQYLAHCSTPSVSETIKKHPDALAIFLPPDALFHASGRMGYYSC